MASSKSRALTRDIILSAALELVDDAGLSALSLRSLGKRLGVSQAAFYRHFPDKAALLEGICEQLWRLTYERFLALVQGADDVHDDAAPGSPAASGASAVSAPAAPGVPTASAPARPDPSPDTEPGSSPAITPQTTPDQALQAQEYIRQYANCLRATLQDHPNTVILLMTHPISTPEQLSLLAGVLASLARSGFTPTTDTLALITSVSVYTTGFVAAEVVPPAGTSDDAVAKPGSAAPAAAPTPAAPSEGADDAVVAGTEDLMAVSAMLDPADAAALQPLIGEVLAGKWDFSAQFERGLEAILRGW
ncbi:MAG: TetR family transcriptional regulator [Actinomyces graevenitzii]|nr:TetR family transcriptional regulator [Actinomyces graevenitzii]